jgi:hypothetical protein
MKSMPATMGGPGDRITTSESTATTLCAPTVRYASTNDSQFDPCMDWRAELWLGHLDTVDEPDVLGGYADFLTIRLGEHSIADMLDSLSQDAENFAGLFDGKYVADSVQEQFQEPFNTVLILLTVLVAEPLRGHDLGAWLAAPPRRTAPIPPFVRAAELSTWQVQYPNRQARGVGQSAIIRKEVGAKVCGERHVYSVGEGDVCS